MDDPDRKVDTNTIGALRGSELPKDLIDWARENHLGEVEVHWSPIAQAVVLKPGGTQHAMFERFRIREAVVHLAGVVQSAARMSWIRGPLVVVIEPVAGPEGAGDEEVSETDWKAWRKVVDRLAADQEWHQGAFSVYLAPPVRDSEWDGPKTAEELVKELVGPGVKGWGTTPLKRIGIEELLSKVEEDLAKGACPKDLDMLLRRPLKEMCGEQPETENTSALAAILRNRIQEQAWAVAGVRGES